MSDESAILKAPPAGPTPENEPGAPVGRTLHRTHRVKWGDALFQGLTTSFASLVLMLIGAIAFVLYSQGHLSISTFGFKFLTSTTWDPVRNEFGALPTMFGTVVSALLAILIAAPISIGIAIFLTEMAPPWLKKPVGLGVEMLAAVPSIIYGMWGLFVFAPMMAKHVQPWIKDHFGFIPLFQGPPMGIGMMTAGIILGIMIIPFIASVARDVFNLVPAMSKESAYGLGATTWEVIRSVVIPHTRSGLVGALFLGLGRALGETMAVTFVIGNAHEIKAGLFNAGGTIASTLANEFTEATTPLYVSSLIQLGLILFVITTLILALAKLMLWRIEAQVKGAER
jgi:phosphate transport system permease protein